MWLYLKESSLKRVMIQLDDSTTPAISPLPRHAHMKKRQLCRSPTEKVKDFAVTEWLRGWCGMLPV
jgi:hypothetical protein